MIEVPVNYHPAEIEDERLKRELEIGHINLYGDLLIHLAFINKFLESNKILVSSPIFALDKPNYPIFADFITAQIAKITSIDFALFSSTFIAGILVIFTARLFIIHFIKNEAVVFLTLCLFLLNGGFGVYYFFQRNYQSPCT